MIIPYYCEDYPEDPPEYCPLKVKKDGPQCTKPGTLSTSKHGKTSQLETGNKGSKSTASSPMRPQT